MKKRFVLEGLGCANCALKMEKALNELEGVQEATVNFITQKAIIEGDREQMPRIIAEATEIIKNIEPDVKITKL